ncbi:MAG: hypothetical protein ICV60_05670 [Pyrinomonadaceae bacterium]|nr:hypothetical protein [Pyrinomonadaceae bacterium]
MMAEKKKPMEDDPIYLLMKGIKCQNCMDTNVAIMLHGPDRCVDCSAQKRQWSSAAIQLQQCVQMRLEKKQLVDKQALSLARVLTHFNVAAPLQLKFIIHYWKTEARLAKGTIALLRDEWVLPIGSLRNPPYGAYWINSAEQFRDWSRPYRAQAITQLVTLYRLQRQWYPRLYGQADFDFLNHINDELKEAMK